MEIHAGMIQLPRTRIGISWRLPAEGVAPLQSCVSSSQGAEAEDFLTTFGTGRIWLICHCRGTVANGITPILQYNAC
jgi:hypothetical protein